MISERSLTIPEAIAQDLSKFGVQHRE